MWHVREITMPTLSMKLNYCLFQIFPTYPSSWRSANNWWSWICRPIRSPDCQTQSRSAPNSLSYPLTMSPWHNYPQILDHWPIWGVWRLVLSFIFMFSAYSSSNIFKRGLSSLNSNVESRARFKFSVHETKLYNNQNTF